MPGSRRSVPHPENEDFVTILTRLEQWKESGILSSEQHTLLAGLSRAEPFSLFLELNVLLYAGVLAFVAGLGWTDRKSTRLNSSHRCISYAVFCLKKKNN